MAQIYHLDNFGTNLTSNTNAGDTTSPLNSIPSISAPFYLAFDATNINGNYEVLQISSKTATNVLHSALAHPHTTAEEVRMVCPAEEMDTWSAALGAYTTGAWTSWTPSWTNMAVGNASVTAKYTQIGKTIIARLSVQFGSTTSISGVPIFTLPVTAVSYPNIGDVIDTIGQLSILDSGTSSYYGVINISSTTTAYLILQNVSGTYPTYSAISPTVPMTWTTGDKFTCLITYEAA